MYMHFTLWELNLTETATFYCIIQWQKLILNIWKLYKSMVELMVLVELESLYQVLKDSSIIITLGLS